MHSSKTRTGLSEAIPNKASPATPKITRLSKRGAKPDSNLPSPLQKPRVSMDESPRSVGSKHLAESRLPKIAPTPAKSDAYSPSSLQKPQLFTDHSPRSVDSKNMTESRLPRISTPRRAKSDTSSSSSLQNSSLSIDQSPSSVDSKSVLERWSPKIIPKLDKPERPLKLSELKDQLSQLQEDLKKARDHLASVENEKAQALAELKEASKTAKEANEKLAEALFAQKRAEESSEIEKFRADELEQMSVEAAKKRGEEWQRELDAIRDQHAIDVAALLSTTQELQRAKQELAMTSEAKNVALHHADDAMKIAEVNAEKVGHLSAEVSHLKALLDSTLQTKSKEAAELAQKLNSEIDSLKRELEKAKEAEIKSAEMEAVIERLRAEVLRARRAAMDAGYSVNEWKEKAELLETQIEEATRAERSAVDSLASIMKQLEGSNVLLQDAESEVTSLREKVDLLEISVDRHKCDMQESEQRLELAKHEAVEMAKTIEVLESELQITKEEKEQALSNEMLASASVQSLLGEKNKLIDKLETIREEEEKNKKAMESLAAALHEASMETRDAKEKLLKSQTDLGNATSQIEDLKLTLETTKEKYETMLDEVKEEIDDLEKLVGNYHLNAKISKDELGEKELVFALALKKSERELAALKGEQARAAEHAKAEWNEKEFSFINCLKQSEEEKDDVKREMEGLVSLLKEAEEKVLITKHDGSCLQTTLTQAEFEASSAKEDAKLANVETLQLKDRLLDTENELRNITQENLDLRARGTAALEKVEELSKLLAEIMVKKAEENSKLSRREKKHNQLPTELKDENKNAVEVEKPKSDRPTDEQHEERGRKDIWKGMVFIEHKEENGNGNAKEENSVGNEVKTIEEGKLPEKEPSVQPIKHEVDSKIESESLDQSKHQRKKNPLLQKFGGLLKKKNNSSK